MDFLTTLDTTCLLAINGWRSLWADYFMYVFSSKLVWVPMYVAILYVLFRNFSWKVALAGVLTIALIVTFADQVSASLIRPIVERLRPSNLNNPVSEYVQIVNGYRGGRFGFPSCHAANTLGLAFYVMYMFRHRWLTLFIFAWAVVTCYSRSYLGVHYPGDLLVGGVVGYLGAALCCRGFEWVAPRLGEYPRKAPMVHVWVPVVVGSLTVAGIAIYASVV